MQQRDQTEDERSCPGCGALESDWSGVDSKGFIAASGDLYCCQSCAQGRACSCNPERMEALVKRRSA